MNLSAKDGYWLQQNEGMGWRLGEITALISCGHMEQWMCSTTSGGKNAGKKIKERESRGWEKGQKTLWICIPHSRYWEIYYRTPITCG